MIKLTSLSGNQLYVNCDLIEQYEANPDTVLVLTTGNKLVVKESPEEVTQEVIEFKQQCFKNINRL